MPKTLLVCSQSTRRFLPKYENVHVVSGAANKQILDMMNSHNDVVAIGGGAVIDTAKIICSSPVICYPTTAAGACMTSHAVCWDGKKKLSIKTHIPKDVKVVSEYVEDLPDTIKEYTTYDAISHCLDSLWSTDSTHRSRSLVHKALAILSEQHTNVDLIKAGNLAGQAIEICPTTILHSLSYPLTAFYNIPHGKALGFLLPRLCKYYDFTLNNLIHYKPIELNNIDWDLIINESLKYEKIHKTKMTINYKILKKIFT